MNGAEWPVISYSRSRAERAEHLEPFHEAAAVEVGAGVDLAAVGVEEDAAFALAGRRDADDVARRDAGLLPARRACSGTGCPRTPSASKENSLTNGTSRIGARPCTSTRSRCVPSTPRRSDVEDAHLPPPVPASKTTHDRAPCCGAQLLRALPD